MSGETKTWEEKIAQVKQQRDRLRRQLSNALQWLELLEDGTNLLPYLREHKCRKVAIYGAAEIGRMLLKEIRQESVVKVSYFLDKTALKQREKWNVPVYLPEEYIDLIEVDMVIVTAVFGFEDIQEKLLRVKPEIPVVSLETIISVRKDEVWYESR